MLHFFQKSKFVMKLPVHIVIVGVMLCQLAVMIDKLSTLSPAELFGERLDVCFLLPQNRTRR